MKAEFPGGSTVSRVYNNSSDAELIAVFAYDGDAVDFAKAKIAEDAARNWIGSHYLVSCSYDGRVKIFRHDEPKPAQVAA